MDATLLSLTDTILKAQRSKKVAPFCQVVETAEQDWEAAGRSLDKLAPPPAKEETESHLRNRRVRAMSQEPPRTSRHKDSTKNLPVVAEAATLPMSRDRQEANAKAQQKETENIASAGLKQRRKEMEKEKQTSLEKVENMESRVYQKRELDNKSDGEDVQAGKRLRLELKLEQDHLVLMAQDVDHNNGGDAVTGEVILIRKSAASKLPDRLMSTTAAIPVPETATELPNNPLGGSNNIRNSAECRGFCIIQKMVIQKQAQANIPIGEFTLLTPGHHLGLGNAPDDPEDSDYCPSELKTDSSNSAESSSNESESDTSSDSENSSDDSDDSEIGAGWVKKPKSKQDKLRGLKFSFSGITLSIAIQNRGPKQHLGNANSKGRWMIMGQSFPYNVPREKTGLPKPNYPAGYFYCGCPEADVLLKFFLWKSFLLEQLRAWVYKLYRNLTGEDFLDVYRWDRTPIQQKQCMLKLRITHMAKDLQSQELADLDNKNVLE
ncbi:hypothetical protein B0H19DRAFT_1058950 [Mycena capillaripes]|nr:hypothetical protein B0H19DRAFT_1058950 [Mycena capillaripes]